MRDHLAVDSDKLRNNFDTLKKSGIIAQHAMRDEFFSNEELTSIFVTLIIQGWFVVKRLYESDKNFDDCSKAHPAVPGWSICSIRVPCAGDLRRARGGTGWRGRDR